MKAETIAVSDSTRIIYDDFDRDVFIIRNGEQNYVVGDEYNRMAMNGYWFDILAVEVSVSDVYRIIHGPTAFANATLAAYAAVLNEARAAQELGND